MNFGEKFKPLLDRTDLSYRELISIFGYTSPGSITDLTKRKNLPPPDKFERICNFFGVPASYFTDAGENFNLHSPDVKYEADKITIPLMESEYADAKVKEILTVPHLGLTSGFAVEITDDRLSGMGIPGGSTVFLTKTFKLSSKHRVIAQSGDQRFFATYEKRENDAIIIPADSKMPLIVIDNLNKSKVTVYAVVTNILIQG